MERRQLQARQAELDDTVACLIVDQREKVGDDDNSTSADSFSDDHLFANISSRLLREYEIEVQLQARAVETKRPCSAFTSTVDVTSLPELGRSGVL